ncbi:MAG: hypothetical protein ACRD1S_03135 [Vicinamibacterales bacterium]
MPILNTLPAYPPLLRWVARGSLGRATGLMLVWAAALGASATLLSWLEPDRTARLFLNADPYRREMFAWVLTGEGRESRLAEFLPQHAGHAALFCGLSLASGSLLSMPLGAALMNYMGHYVGALAAESASPWRTLLLAWPPWAVVRIASFVTLGVVLAQPLLSLAARPVDATTRRAIRFAHSSRRLVLFAFAGLLLDVVLKWLLAPEWQPLLRRAVGW